MYQHHSAQLPDGKRLHLQQGPIDLIIAAEGTETEVQKAFEQANLVFDGLLARLVLDLGALRSPYSADLLVHGDVAQRMVRAVAPFASQFVTPMAAVAGSVADHVCQHICKTCDLTKLYVNNGGDIALFLASGESYRVGLVADVEQPGLNGTIDITADQGIGGIASSGWKGRSHSCGIADTVTVLADCAAEADVAATLIANAVNLPACDKITRQPAHSLDLDSDLGERLVTVDVKRLSADEVEEALSAGEAQAQEYLAQGLIKACALTLQGSSRIVGTTCLPSILQSTQLNQLEGAQL
ncbi:UPF0280 family protein [Terasakiella pusilla]|uniref:UPF0280 family protein n=1 Tax=Terasakiella pusilla TaxID=64973 RepID=UPI003AA89F99